MAFVILNAFKVRQITRHTKQFDEVFET